MKKLMFFYVLIFSFTLKGQEDSVTIEREIFTIVEDMPVWPSCAEIKSKQEKQNCSNEAIYFFVEEKAKQYQLKEDQNGGVAFVRFVIDENGDVFEPLVLKGIPNEPQLDSIAVAIVGSLPKILPGKQRGEPVRVQYNVPVKFNR